MSKQIEPLTGLMLRLHGPGPKVAARKGKQDATCPAPKSIRQLVSKSSIPRAPIAVSRHDCAATFAYTLSMYLLSRGQTLSVRLPLEGGRLNIENKTVHE